VFIVSTEVSETSCALAQQYSLVPLRSSLTLSEGTWKELSFGGIVCRVGQSIAQSL
jgi:hypothetical protein